MGSPCSLFLSPSLPSRGGPSLASPRGKDGHPIHVSNRWGLTFLSILPPFSALLAFVLDRQGVAIRSSILARQGVAVISLIRPSSPLLSYQTGSLCFSFSIFSLSLFLSLSFATSRMWPPVPFPKRGEGCLSSPFC